MVVLHYSAVRLLLPNLKQFEIKWSHHHHFDQVTKKFDDQAGNGVGGRYRIKCS
jgi:hypothetical protein